MVFDVLLIIGYRRWLEFCILVLVDDLIGYLLVDIVMVFNGIY